MRRPRAMAMTSPRYVRSYAAEAGQDGVPTRGDPETCRMRWHDLSVMAGIAQGCSPNEVHRASFQRTPPSMCELTGAFRSGSDRSSGQLSTHPPWALDGGPSDQGVTSSACWLSVMCPSMLPANMVEVEPASLPPTH
jgi:hypothetical protein